MITPSSQPETAALLKSRKPRTLWPSIFAVGAFFTLAGCQSSPEKTSPKSTAQKQEGKIPANPFQREVHIIPETSWGGYEPFVTRARQNITLYAYAVTEKLKGEEQSSALKMIEDTRTHITTTQIQFANDNSFDLAPFMEWLKEINEWALQEREHILHH